MPSAGRPPWQPPRNTANGGNSRIACAEHIRFNRRVYSKIRNRRSPSHALYSAPSAIAPNAAPLPSAAVLQTLNAAPNAPPCSRSIFPRRHQMKLPAVLYVDDNEDEVLLFQLAWKQVQVRNPLHIARNFDEAIDYL